MTDAQPPTVPIQLALHYQHAMGALAPYFEALLAGRALASRCPRCGRVSCPPDVQCSVDACPTEWLELTGTGTLLAATITTTVLPLRTDAAAPIAFGLVRLDGAANAMFARLGISADRAHPGLRVALVRAPGTPPHPAQAAWFVAADRPAPPTAPAHSSVS